MTYLDFERPLEQLDAELERILADPDQQQREMNAAPVRAQIGSLQKKIFQDLTPWQRVQLARHPARPYTLDYIRILFTDFMELHGDRRFSDDEAMVGGFARLDGRPVMVIGTQKGRNTKENVLRNFGCPHPEGYRKALRLMQIAERAKLPVITFIDTPGAFPGVASEERHIGEAIAVNLREMFNLTVPVVSVVIGEGGSGGALGIGVGNEVHIMENAYYSVITPEGCAAILWKDRAFSPKAAEALKLTAADLLKLKLVDSVIAEPDGGAHRNPEAAAAAVRKVLLHSLKRLEKMSPEERVEQRYHRFRDVAFYKEETPEEVSSEGAGETRS